MTRTLTWIEQHPRTMGWIALMTTLNFILALLDAAGVT